MTAQFTIFGKAIALEALLLLIIGTVIALYIIRELFYLFFFKSLYIWCGIFIAFGGFALAAFKIPNDLQSRMHARRKPFRETFKQYAFYRSDKWNEEVTALKEDEEMPFSVYPESFLVSDSLNQLIEYVIRDFVKSWYASISNDSIFPSQVDHALRVMFATLVVQSVQINWADVIVTKMLPILSEHFRKFTMADSAVREKSMGRMVTDNNEFQYAVALQYSQGRLHPALQPLKHYQYESYRKNWLRDLCSKYVPILLGPTATSTVVNHLAHDILACSVLFPSLTMLSDPDFWNQQIVNLAGPTLQDRKKVEQLRKALNEHATLGSSSSVDSSKTSLLETAVRSLSSTSTQNEYNRFMKILQKSKSAAELRKIRRHITSEIQSLSQEKTDNVHMSKLYQAKELAETRLKKLIGSLTDIENYNDDFCDLGKEGGLLNDDTRRSYTLSQILSDPAFCASFKEFMNLSERGLLLQYWITINCLRNPLEENGDDEDGEGSEGQFRDKYDSYYSKRNSHSSLFSVKASNSGNSDSMTSSYLSSTSDKETPPITVSLITEHDIYQIYDTYFNGKMPCISADAQATVQNYLESRKKTPEMLDQVRRTLTHIQNAVFKEIQDNDLVKYKKSDVFLNFLASERKTTSEKTARQAESTIDSLQMDSISDYEGPERENSQILDQPNEKDVEDIEKVFDTIMREKGNTATGPKSSLFSANDSTTVGNFFSKPDSKLHGSTEYIKSSKPDTTAQGNGVKSRHKRSSSGFTPLFDDSDSDVYSDINTGDGVEFENEDEQTSELHLAAPGDLGLTEAINMLSKQIKVLYRQERVLEPLLRKAELTNNVGNLRILRKSKASLEREIQRKELQRQQYIVQESDNSLYGRSNIQIRSYMSARDSNGPFIMYVIEVEKLASDGNISAGWVVARRYSQFFQLHQLLRSMFPEVRKLSFPKKRVVLKFQQKSFADARRTALQKYLRNLLQIPAVCRSKAFRMFLSSETFSVDSVKSPIDDVAYETAAATATAGKMDSSLYADDDDSDSESNLDTDLDHPNFLEDPSAGTNYATMALEAEAEVDDMSRKPFIQPICDFFIQLFGFDRGNNWVRGRAVVVVVQQILGGTIERKIREAVAGNLATEQSFTDAVQKLMDIMWPQGASFMETQAEKAAIPERSGAEKMKCKHDARIIVYTLIRDACVKIVGSTSSKYAAYNLFEMFQHEKLNAHLIYSLLDVLLDELFSDV